MRQLGEVVGLGRGKEGCPKRVVLKNDSLLNFFFYNVQSKKVARFLKVSHLLSEHHKKCAKRRQTHCKLSYLAHCQCELLNYLDTNAQLKPKK